MSDTVLVSDIVQEDAVYFVRDICATFALQLLYLAIFKRDN